MHVAICPPKSLGVKKIRRCDFNCIIEVSSYINDTKDVAAYKEFLIGKMESLTERRNELRNIVRRNIPEKDKEKMKGEIKDISEKLKTIREEVKLCDNIETRSLKMKDNLERIEDERNKDKEKEMIKR